jgi:small subunit ribosomal protein S1
MNSSKTSDEENKPVGSQSSKSNSKPDLSSLGSMLQARWKGGPPSSKPEPVQTGQIRKFRIAKLDPATKKIELELA